MKQIKSTVSTNDAGVHYGTSCVQNLYESQVDRSPDHAAIIKNSEVISYRELNRRANDLARALITQKLSPDSIVALFSDRSVEMVVGILGILKSGAAYVPLDPYYPAERLRFIVRDSGASLVVVPQSLRGQLPDVDCDTIEISGPTTEKNEDNDKNPITAVSGHNLAYVIYTSGSTGQPKGVSLEHKGLADLISFTREQMEVGPNDRVLQFASFSFDASIWEIFVALISGATLVLADTENLLPGPGLNDLLRRQGVTIALLSPSVLRLLPSGGLDDLRIVVTGTEKCTADIVQRWAPGRRFFNSYGLTETTIYNTIFEFNEISDEAPSIGRPVPNSEVYILDDNMAPVSGDESGILYIGGPGVGRSYVNRPELTAEKFVEINVAGKKRRVFKTGDLARWRADGNLDYLGRADHQVKIRGYRVELGEIEATLEQHREIRSAVVVKGTDSLGQATLWAYCIPKAGRLDVVQIREFLAGKLPYYMLPSAYVQMDHWPLTHNGKVNRRALPPPDRSRPVLKTEYIAPRNNIEKEIADIWSALLRVEQIGVNDEFVELGGHSLLATMFVARINEKFGMNYEPGSLFEFSTVARFAELVSTTRVLTAQTGPASGTVVEEGEI